MKEILNNYLERFNINLKELFNNLEKNSPKIIKEAMEYAVSGGGKRIRPVLCYAVCDMLNVDLSKADKLALAIELIHSYSLVHDDLPAMDNDDYRRGKLSTHKKFGEANGILCGDALLNYAIEIALSYNKIDKNYINALRTLFNLSGYSGMIAGQVLDLQNENKNEYTHKDLYDIYENKTAKLLSAPILMASNLASDLFYKELKDYSYNLGILFQITDDFMDIYGTLEQIGKTPNKDIEENKLTSIKVFGIEGARKLMDEHYKKAIYSIKDIPNNDFLIDFTNYIYKRKA